MCFLVFGAITPLVAQQSTGVIHFQSEGDRMYNASCWFNHQKLYIQVYKENGDTIRRIVDRIKGEVITLIEQDGKPIAVKMNDRMSRYLQKVNALHALDKNASDYQCDLLTEQQEIRDKQCMKVTAKGKKYDGLAWMDHSLPKKMNTLLAFIFFEDEHFIHFVDSPGFPLQWTQESLKGKDKARWTIHAIPTFQIVPTEIFTLKAGIELVDFTNTRELMVQTKENPRAIIQIKQMMQTIDGE